MAILSGYEYDIFISYRHNDNRSGWVTEFVNALQEELASTIKEPVTIYFDKNPHDGLLETHNVDKSLEEKLKCLIFIPIISQTYCDPKSFAWQHEFVAFNKLAKEDQFGRDIKLINGNVASRILPVKIHDLDADDKTTIEKEIGGILRAIEFTFKSSGVNRPLRLLEEHQQDNINKTFYRDQINKVANAVKELIHAIKSPTEITGVQNITTVGSKKRSKSPYLVTVFVLMVILGSYFLYQYLIVKSNLVSNSEKSIAVLPFSNLSNDPEQEYFSDGITEQVISSLARLKDIKVIARTSVQQYKNTKKSISQIGKELDVAYVLESSVRKSGDQMRVTAQLILVKDETHLWAQDFDNQVTSNVIPIQDAVAAKIATSLKNQLLPAEKEKLKTEQPSRPEAYEHYIRGDYLADNFAMKSSKEDFLNAEQEYKQAIEIDPNYATAKAGLADLYDTYANYSTTPEDKIKYQKLCSELALQAYRLNPTLPIVLTVQFESWRYDYDSAFKYGKLALEAGPNFGFINREFGNWYTSMGLQQQAIALLEHANRIAPGSFSEAYLALGHYRFGNFSLAEKYLTNKSLDKDTTHIMRLYVLCALRCDQHRFGEAEKILARIKQLNMNMDISNLEAYYFASKGEKKQALAKRRNALVYAILKMKQELLDELQKAPLNYSALKAKSFDFMRDDERFKTIELKARELYEQRLQKYGSIELPKD